MEVPEKLLGEVRNFSGPSPLDTRTIWASEERILTKDKSDHGSIVAPYSEKPQHEVDRVEVRVKTRNSLGEVSTPVNQEFFHGSFRLQSIPSREHSLMMYNAFISYSHAADGKLAPALQSALHKFAKPWYRFRVLHVFRDQTSLSASPALWPSIETALSKSDYFLLLASPHAAQSPWVQKELDWWFTHRSPEKILTVLTEGELVWDANRRDFDWQRTSALPRAVSEKFADVPLYVDLRWAKTVDHLSLRNTQFHSAILDLATPLHGKPKDELDGEDVRQYRNTRRLVLIVVVLLLLLTLGAGLAAYLALQQSKTAQSRAIAANAKVQLSIDPEQSVAWAMEAMKVSPTAEAEATLRESLFASRVRAKILLPMQHHNDRPWQVAFSADSTRVVAANERMGKVKVLNLEKDEAEHRIAMVEGRAFTDGNWVLTVNNSGAAIVWDVETGKEVLRLGDNLKGVSYAIFSPDRTRIFTSGEEQPGRIWEVATLHVQDLSEGLTQVTQAAFSTDDQFLVTVNSAHQAQLWEGKTGLFLRDLPGHTSSRSGHITEVTTAQFSADGVHLATACGAGAGCYVEEGMDSDGNGIADFDGTIRLWKRNGNTFDLDRELPGEGTDRVYGLAFATDSVLLAGTRGDGVALAWKVNTGELVSTFTNHANWVWSAAFSPRGNLVVTTGSLDGTARLWEPRARGRELLVLRGHQSFVQSAIFSPDGRFALTIGDDETARVWELNTRQSVPPSDQEQSRRVQPPMARTISPTVKESPCSEQWHPQCWTQAVWSPDHRVVVTFNDQERSNTTVKAWDAATGELLRSLGTHKDGVHNVAWSEDGQFVIVIDAMGNTARVWEIGSQKKPLDLIGHTSRISHAAFSPSNACIVTGSREGTDGTVRVWQTTTGTILATLWGYDGGVEAVAFDAASKAVIVQSHDGMVWTHAAEGCALGTDLLPFVQTYNEKNLRWY